MYSQTPKILHKILGKEIILFAVDLARNIGSRKIIIVADRNIRRVRKITGAGVRYVLQSEPLGTGDAAQKGIRAAAFRSVLIMNGDVPMLDPAMIKNMIASHIKNKMTLTFLSCVVKDASGYGRVIRKSQKRLCGIVEHADASKEQLMVQEINVGVYFGERNAIISALKRIDRSNKQGELYLTDIIGIFLKSGMKVQAYRIRDEEQIMGINTKYDLACVRERIKHKWYRELMDKGVLIEDPDSTTIDLSVKFGRYVHIKPNVIIEGRTAIKDGAVIEPFTLIRNGKNIRSSKRKNA